MARPPPGSSRGRRSRLISSLPGQPAARCRGPARCALPAAGGMTLPGAGPPPGPSGTPAAIRSSPVTCSATWRCSRSQSSITPRPWESGPSSMSRTAAASASDSIGVPSVSSSRSGVVPTSSTLLTTKQALTAAPNTRSPMPEGSWRSAMKARIAPSVSSRSSSSASPIKSAAANSTGREPSSGMISSATETMCSSKHTPGSQAARTPRRSSSASTLTAHGSAKARRISAPRRAPETVFSAPASSASVASSAVCRSTAKPRRMP